ncbi:alpha-hydroxy acid oxidase [Amycolatopsis pithecellobii]|uniref:Alpha-hydroxy-acid oxidizing enzyme n=1 Tax=Amycolatopsis pithecellobii TaxID=664692 RepID=A0A6N7Z334_9PSEU|nr:alpha-hydroxy acid oxidase [Amycolatopsis pithecellobii]MTD55449.1 alpha-hydroxy-acid oxidizing enzyme [Amycolatopsis pithecellobii]
MLRNNVIQRMNSVADAEQLARRAVPRFLFQRFQGGAGKGISLEANVAAFERTGLKARHATFTPVRDLRTTFLGHELSMPVIAAPVGLLGLGRRGGEIAVARAADSAGTVQIVSGLTTTPIEEVAAATPAPTFFQLYYLGGRDVAEQAIQRARDSKCAGLVLTIDTQAPASYERPLRERAFAPTSLRYGQLTRVAPQVAARPGWALEFARSRGRLNVPMGGAKDGRPMTMFEVGSAIYRRTPAWTDFEWIREAWQGPLIVKGVMSAEDALKAVDHGAAAVIVSNHGGNVLDGQPATLSVLPEVLDAVDGRAEVLVDGGIRRGSDVVKAIAMGAKAVLVGRAYLYGLLAAGEPGVARVLQLLRQGIDDTLAGLGCDSVTALDGSYLR